MGNGPQLCDNKFSGPFLQVKEKRELLFFSLAYLTVSSLFLHLIQSSKVKRWILPWNLWRELKFPVVSSSFKGGKFMKHLFLITFKWSVWFMYELPMDIMHVKPKKT